jgi:hypothetical protein
MADDTPLHDAPGATLKGGGGLAEVIRALVARGYSHAEAARAVELVRVEGVRAASAFLEAVAPPGPPGSNNEHARPAEPAADDELPDDPEPPPGG